MTRSQFRHGRLSDDVILKRNYMMDVNWCTTKDSPFTVLKLHKRKRDKNACLARSQNCEMRLLASLFLSVRPAVSLHGTTRLPLDGFAWNLTYVDLSKIKYYYNLTRITDTLHEDLCKFKTVSRWIFSRLRKFSDNSCRENQNTHLMLNNFFFEDLDVYEIIWKKYGPARQATDDNILRMRKTC
jgi:hypothetical protein